MADRLPIYQSESDILAALQQRRRLIVSAPTGSGKSTQVPQMLLDHGLLGKGQVVVLQPRRLAARLLAKRVAWERKSHLGEEVGFQIRFENVTSQRTRIRFVTEGVLLRQMIQDAKLPGVSALIFDEFHERHLYGDITLAQALALQETQRPDLKIVVMSATLDEARLEDYLEPCRLVQAEGRTFPVDIHYSERPSYADSRPIWEQAAAAFEEFAHSDGQGDVLIFMPGRYEIIRTIEALGRFPATRSFVILPLHGELAPREEDAAVASYDQRKVVVATNVAETSLTIPGIRCVIDSGLARIPRYDPYRGINTLWIEKISRAAAEQRAGRAGRTAPGLCLRLWSQEEHAHRPAQELPEIKRLDLAEVVLTLKAAGVEDLRRFRWLEPPDDKSLERAQALLRDLGAIQASPEDILLRPKYYGGQEVQRPESKAGSPAVHQPSTIHYQLTDLGRCMLAFPLHPRYSRLLLAAREYGCVRDCCLLAALAQGPELQARIRDGQCDSERKVLADGNEEGDFDVLLRAWRTASEHDFQSETCRRLGLNTAAARQVAPVWQQFLEIATREGLDTTEHKVPAAALHKCILTAFSDRVARRLDAKSLRCDMVYGRRGTLARESVVRSQTLFVAAEAREIEGKDKDLTMVLSLATPIEESWLRELFPDDLSSTGRVFYDAAARRVMAEEQVRFRDLEIGSRRIEPPPAGAAAQLLAQEVLAGRLTLDDWDSSVEQWILRLNQLAQWCPELALPPIGEPERALLIEQLCEGAFSYKDIKGRNVKSIVKSWLNSSQLDLVERHAPERFSLTNGRSVRVNYQTGAPPHIAARIQELYDVTATPSIAMGRVPVVIHILAPSRRPVQITQDLAGFWREHYPQLKRELQRKYPKHEWR